MSAERACSNQEAAGIFQHASYWSTTKIEKKKKKHSNTETVKKKKNKSRGLRGNLIAARNSKPGHKTKFGELRAKVQQYRTYMYNHLSTYITGATGFALANTNCNSNKRMY